MLASNKAEMHLLMQIYGYHEQTQILQKPHEPLNYDNINNSNSGSLNWSIDL